MMQSRRYQFLNEHNEVIAEFQTGANGLKGRNLPILFGEALCAEALAAFADLDLEITAGNFDPLLIQDIKAVKVDKNIANLSDISKFLFSDVAQIGYDTTDNKVAPTVRERLVSRFPQLDF